MTLSVRPHLRPCIVLALLYSAALCVCAVPIVTPNRRLLAKSIHEVVSHLGNTHLVLEGPMVAMNRQLPREHPIHALLQPHVEGTALINWGAQEASNCCRYVVALLSYLYSKTRSELSVLHFLLRTSLVSTFSYIQVDLFRFYLLTRKSWLR